MKTFEEGKMRKYEDGGRNPEGLLEERLEGEGGDMATVERAKSRDRILRPVAVVSGQEQGRMTEGDRIRAQGDYSILIQLVHCGRVYKAVHFGVFTPSTSIERHFSIILFLFLLHNPFEQFYHGSLDRSLTALALW